MPLTLDVYVRHAFALRNGASPTGELLPERQSKLRAYLSSWRDTVRTSWRDIAAICIVAYAMIVVV